MAQRYITTWRETGNRVLDWEYYVSGDELEVSVVVGNITKRGVHQYHTYPIGDIVERWSSKY